MIKDELKSKILILSEKAWEKKLDWPAVESWLNNFDGKYTDVDEERLHALYLLTQNMYFGQDLIREMLYSVYEHLFRYPIIKKIRKDNNDTLDETIIEPIFEERLKNTRFLGVGNPSESGPHLLYYFRQVNDIAKDLFVDSSEILSFTRDLQGRITFSQKDSTVERYIFIDDVLGSGNQIRTYLEDILRELRLCAPNVEIYYFSLFASANGLSEARKPDLFDGDVESVYELDESFKCFHEGARCFKNKPDEIDKDVAMEVARTYGSELWPPHPLGYENGQLLLALAHNTPDNSLPIFWYELPQYKAWSSIFKRFHKKY